MIENGRKPDNSMRKKIVLLSSVTVFKSSHRDLNAEQHKPDWPKTETISIWCRNVK